MDKVYEFRAGAVKEHLGGIQDFLRKLHIDTLRELERRDTPSAPAASAAPETPSKPAPVDYAALREQSKAEKKKRQRIDFLEKQIAKDESRMKAIEAVLSAPGEGDDIMELTREYLELKRDCDAWTSEWVELND